MAQFKISLFDGEPMVTAFEFDKEAMLNSNLKVLFFDNYSEDWLDFVISNREGKATEHYDFVYGPIANDKVGLKGCCPMPKERTLFGYVISFT